ncbi:MAG: ABC transporter permease [Methanomassiliicoccus sp.]|nr:ABC transporter permease [Methanomassiliicoccus sp.]
MSLLSNIDSGAVLVWRRNADVFFKTWKTNFLPSIIEPLLYLVAMGAGLGGLIVGLTYAGQDINYVRFLAPGLVAISIMYGGFFECTYGSFVRMHYQKTFDAIVATPVSLEDVIAGEILWGASKSFLNSSIVLLVIETMGLTLVPEVWYASPTVLLVPLLAFLGGLMFSSIAMIFTAVVPNIDSFNYPFYLLVTPMFLLGGTFFPISQLGAAEPIAYIFPLTHVSILVRNMCLGLVGWIDLAALVYVTAATVITFIPAVYLMRKRLVR